MKKIIRIVVLAVSLFFISIISFNCKEDEIRIWGIELNAYGSQLYEDINLYTKDTGLNFDINTKYDYFGALYKPSSSCYAFDPGIEVLNPIDTNTIDFFCKSSIIIVQDTILPNVNLFMENKFREHIRIHEDRHGGYLFSLTREDNFFEENMDFIYESDSIFTFVFKAKTVDNILLTDSVKIKVNWN